MVEAMFSDRRTSALLLLLFLVSVVLQPVDGQGKKGAVAFTTAAGIDAPKGVLALRLGMHNGKNPMVVPGGEHFVVGAERVSKAPAPFYHSKSSMVDRKPGNARNEVYSLAMIGAPFGGGDGTDTSSLNWLLVNCPLDTNGNIDLSGCEIGKEYEAPNPAIGTRTYIFFLYQQPDKIEVPTAEDLGEPGKFHLKEFTDKRNLGSPSAWNYYYCSKTQDDADAAKGVKKEL